MTRIWTSGAESGSILEADSVASSATVTTTAPRSGTYHYLASNGTTAGLQKTLSSSSESEIYFRFAYSIPAGASAGSTTKCFSIEDSSGNVLMELRWGAGIAMTAYVGASLVETSAGSMPAAGAYGVIQGYYKLADSGGRIVIKVDAATYIDYTGDTKPGSATTMYLLRWTRNVGGGSTIYIDDIAINTAAGSAPDNTYPVDGKVYALLPNADGDSSQWVGSDGNSTNNYLLVDERPPNTSDYVQENTLNDVDLYNLAAVSPALTSGDVITRVWATVYGQRNNAVSNQNMQVGLKSGGTTDWDTNSISLGTAYAMFTSKEWLTDPNGSAAWTESALNALQAGIKVV